MRLAYFLGTYPQPSETFIAREVEGLRARGHAVRIFSLFAPPGGPQCGVAYGWASGAARARRKLFPRQALRALTRRWGAQLAAESYDAVVAHFGSLPSTVALAAAADLPCLLSLHARDLYVEAERLAEKIAAARAVITCTQANVDYLRDRYPAYAEKIQLIYHGLPRTWLDAPIPERQRSTGEPLRLLAVGRFVEKKGFGVLLAACAQVQARGVPFVVRVVGDGPLRNTLVHQLQHAGLQHAVTVEGWKDDGPLRAAYAWADVFCCPSVLARDGDRDGLPNVLVEAMASGLPAIGSRLSGIPEAIEEGVSGLLTSPGDVDALAAAIVGVRDPARRAAMGASAAARIRQHFSAEQWLDRLQDILTALR